jgi:hypothetical protein
MRIGFLFNHYAAHQVPHCAPYAFELSRRHPQHEVLIACSTDAELEFARSIGELYPGHDCQPVRLRAGLVNRIVDPLLSRWWTFSRKTSVLRNNLPFFESLDVLVSPERHCVKLRKMLRSDLKFIHTRHGAGDREGSFDERLQDFDLTLVPGKKTAARLLDLGYARPDQLAVAGSCKLEVGQALQRDVSRLFDNDRPVVLYAPHFDRSVSSWWSMGRGVLDYFASSTKYNLIFAPHVLLLKRRVKYRARLPRIPSGLPHIHVDTGSTASVDMSYTNAADIYLGDVSSQVYEFVERPRPCIFLNATGADWRDDPHYLHWTMGEVIDDVSAQLGPALDRAFDSHSRYRARQEELVAYTYESDASLAAAQRGADAIAAFLKGAAPDARLPLAATSARPVAACIPSAEVGHSGDLI